jgi:MFS family permease
LTQTTPQPEELLLSRPPTSDVPATGRPAQPGPAGPGVPAPPSLPQYTLPLAFGLQAVISAGDGLAMIALASRVYQGSHASWAVAAVFLAVTIPITALAPLAGLLLDRLPPRPVLITAAAGQAAVALALTQVAGIGPVLALATGFGVCAAVLQPGLGAIVPRLVGPAGQADQLDQAGRAAGARRAGVTRANGYLQAATWGGFTVGPLLAAALVATGGTGLALAGVAVIYTLGTLGLWALPLAPPDGPADAGRGGFAAQLGAGLRFLRQDGDAGLLVLVVGVMVVFANMAVVAEVAFAESVLGAGPTGYSVLVAAWTAGMLAGTLAGGRLPEHRLALATLIGTLATGAGVALAGTAAVLWQAAAAYAFGGLANGFEVVATRSFLNHRAPPQVAGRVFAVYSGVLFGAASVGMAAAGGLLGSLNPRLVLLLAGGGGLVAAGAGSLFYARRHARAAPSAQARPAPAPDAPPETAPPEPAPHPTAPPGRAPHVTAPHPAGPPERAPPMTAPATTAPPPDRPAGRQ